MDESVTRSKSNLRALNYHWKENPQRLGLMAGTFAITLTEFHIGYAYVFKSLN